MRSNEEWSLPWGGTSVAKRWVQVDRQRFAVVVEALPGNYAFAGAEQRQCLEPGAF